mgnify:FL=1
MARTSTVTKQDIINDVHRVAAAHDGTVRVKNYVADGAFSLGTVRNVFGASKNETFVQILGMEATNDAPDVSTVRMLVKKFAKQMGKDGIKLTEKEFDTHAGISSALVAETFGSFAKGIADSGYVVGEVVEVAPRKKRCDAKNAEEANEDTAEVASVATPEVVDEDAPEVVDEDWNEDTAEEAEEDTAEDEDWNEEEYEEAEDWDEDWGEYPSDEDMDFDSGYDWGEDYDEDAPVNMDEDILSALQNAFA